MIIVTSNVHTTSYGRCAMEPKRSRTHHTVEHIIVWIDNPSDELLVIESLRHVLVAGTSSFDRVLLQSLGIHRHENQGICTRVNGQGYRNNALLERTIRRRAEFSLLHIELLGRLNDW